MTKNVFVTIAGRANAGKSSLMNRLVGEKIAMVSNKPQTTRTKITGVLTEDEIQYVFMDTPGIHKPKNKLSEHMLEAVKNSVADVDVAVFMVDATKPVGEPESALAANLRASRTPAILVINKIDLLENKEEVAPIIAKASELYTFEAVIPVSVTQNDGVDIIKEEITKHASEGPHFFPDDTLTDQPERVLAAEIIREKILRLMHDEVPHGIAVTIEEMKERDDKDILDISAVIFCEKDSHKGMVIGKGGEMLKKIGTNARIDLERFFEIKVNLRCWVKVKEDWRNKEGLIKDFGLSNTSTDM